MRPQRVVGWKTWRQKRLLTVLHGYWVIWLVDVVGARMGGGHEEKRPSGEGRICDINKWR